MPDVEDFAAPCGCKPPTRYLPLTGGDRFYRCEEHHLPYVIRGHVEKVITLTIEEKT